MPERALTALYPLRERATSAARGEGGRSVVPWTDRPTPLTPTLSHEGRGRTSRTAHARGLGVDGIKTGHTTEAGYCLAVSGVQDGKRLILIVFGLSSEKTRAEEGERLLSWGFREFASYTLFKSGEVLDVAPVFMGAESSVELVAPHDLDVRMLRSVRAQMTVTLRYQAPLVAPLAAGQEVAILSVEALGLSPIDLPVVTAQAVDEAGLFGRMLEGVLSLVN